MRKVKSVRQAILAAAVISTVPAFAQVNGAIDSGEYPLGALSLQTVPTGFGDNFNELNGFYAKLDASGGLQYIVTGNLEAGSNEGGGVNRLLVMIDARSGGGIASTLPGGFGVFGSIGGAGTDDWGTDTDGGFGVNPTPGGPSILFPGFNPEYSIESNRFAQSDINNGGPNDRSYINVIDLTFENGPTPTGLGNNRDIYVGFTDVLPPRGPQFDDPNKLVSRPLTYNRASGQTDPNTGNEIFVPAGTGVASFNNSNTAGVFGFDFATPPGLLGDPISSTTGLEYSWDSQFVNNLPGQPIRVLVVLTNSGGDFLSNQFLGGNGGLVADPANAPSNLGGPGGDGGTPLFDSQLFPNLTYIEIPIATKTLFGASDYYDNSNWNHVAQNGVNTTARIVSPASGGSDVSITAATTLGGLILENSSGSGVSVNGSAGITIDTYEEIYAHRGLIAGRGTSGSHFINVPVNVAVQNLELEVAADVSLTITGALTGVVNLTKTGTGLGSIPASTAFTTISVNEGTLALNPDTNGVFVVPSTSTLTIAVGAALDTTTNDLIVDYTGTSPLTDLVNLQLNGQLLSATDFGGVSTLLVLFEASDLGLTEFNGVTVDADAVLGKYTYSGDGNLDGQVDAFDYSLVDDNFGQAGTFTTGDLNGDGLVDAFDYSSIDDTFGAGVGSPLRPAANTEVFIPEPSSLGFLALAGGLLARRRRA